MQYPQHVPNILLSGDNAFFEKFALAFRMEMRVSAAVCRIAPLLMGLVLALHFAAWQFLTAVRVEYGWVVIGLAVLALLIFAMAYLVKPSPARRWLDLGLRLLYAVVVCCLVLAYSEIDYLPAIDYSQHLHVRRHLFAPLSVSVLIGALGLLITAPIWGEPKLFIYALALALAACWISSASNVSSSLVINTRPDVNAQAPVPAQTPVQAQTPTQAPTQEPVPVPVKPGRRKNVDSVLNATDIRALSNFDTPATLNDRVRSRINAERNLCLAAALAAFGFCMVCVWALRTWLQSHGIHSRRDVVEVLQFLRDRPSPHA